MMGKFSDVYFSTRTEIKKENIIMQICENIVYSVILSWDKKTLYTTLKKNEEIKMALSKKNNEQISFDELEFEAEYSEQTETKYLTIA